MRRAGLIVVAVAAAAVTGVGFAWLHDDGVADAVAAVPRSSTVPLAPQPAPVPTDQVGRWAATSLARPIFSPDRRPAADSAAAGQGVMKLQGTIIGPSSRLAIFAGAAGGKPVVVHEHDRLGPLGIETIRPGEVAASGPDGRVMLRMRAAPAVPPAPFQAPSLSHWQGDNDQHAE